MKKRFLHTIVLIAGLSVFSVCSNHVYCQTTKNKLANQQIVKYTCEMHTQVSEEKPGNCPVCGMKLVEEKDNMKGLAHHSNDSTMIKQEHKKMMCDSTIMIMKYLRPDSTSIRKERMMHDSTYIMHDKMKMYYQQ